MFEIEIHIRDSQGNPTNKKKSYRTNSAFDLFTWFNKNSFSPRKKKRKDKGIATKEDSAKIINQINKDVK